jgi:hypothetical protein
MIASAAILLQLLSEDRARSEAAAAAAPASAMTNLRPSARRVMDALDEVYPDKGSSPYVWDSDAK